MWKGIVFVSLVFVVSISRVAALTGPVGSVCIAAQREEYSQRVYNAKPYTGSRWWGYVKECETEVSVEYHTKWNMQDVCCVGYENINGECQPRCEGSCHHGSCVRPEVCDCDPGYTLHAAANRCVPVCVERCNFGTCTAPEICTCDYGYTKIDNSSNCEPKCTDDCVSGTCIAPETCRCHVGYEKSVRSNFVCIPVCNETCVFGKCIAPNTCVCDVGYAMTSQSGNVCEPVCTNGCLHGTCEQPNECKCDQGFFKDEKINGTCIPICEPSCIHGRCTVGGCSCYFGWEGASCNESRYCLLGAPPELTADGNQIASIASSLDRSATTISQSTKAYAFEEYQSTTDSTSQSTIFEYDDTSPNGISESKLDRSRRESEWHVTPTGNNNEFTTSAEIVFTVDSQSTVSMEVEFTEDRRIHWAGPACHPKCWNAVGQQSVYSGSTSMNRTYSFLLTDSPCNFADDGMKLSTIQGVIIASTGVLLFGTIVAVLGTYRRMRKRSMSGAGTAISEESSEIGNIHFCNEDVFYATLTPQEIHKPAGNCDSHEN